MATPVAHLAGLKTNSAAISSGGWPHNFSVGRPDGLEDNNHVFVFLSYSLAGNAASVSPPSGFVLRAHVTEDSWNRPVLFIYSKFISDAAGEPSSYVFQASNSSPSDDSARITAIRVSGADDNTLGQNKREAHSFSTFVSSWTLAGIEAPANNMLRLGSVVWRNVPSNLVITEPATGVSVLQAALVELHPNIIAADDVGEGPTGDLTAKVDHETNEGRAAGAFLLIAPAETGTPPTADTLSNPTPLSSTRIRVDVGTGTGADRRDAHASTEPILDPDESTLHEADITIVDGRYTFEGLDDPSTAYFFRVVAENEVGTAVSNEVSESTLAPLEADFEVGVEAIGAVAAAFGTARSTARGLPLSVDLPGAPRHADFGTARSVARGLPLSTVAGQFVLSNELEVAVPAGALALDFGTARSVSRGLPLSADVVGAPRHADFGTARSLARALPLSVAAETGIVAVAFGTARSRARARPLTVTLGVQDAVFRHASTSYVLPEPDQAVEIQAGEMFVTEVDADVWQFVASPGPEGADPGFYSTGGDFAFAASPPPDSIRARMSHRNGRGIVYHDAIILTTTIGATF